MDFSVYSEKTQHFCFRCSYESFVGRLKEQHELEQVNVPGLKASGPGKMNLSMAERVIYFRPKYVFKIMSTMRSPAWDSVTDVTGMPPKVGNVALTDEHLIFQSKIRSSSVTFYKLATLQIEKRTIESFIRRNNAIVCNFFLRPKRKIACFFCNSN